MLLRVRVTLDPEVAVSTKPTPGSWNDRILKFLLRKLNSMSLFSDEVDAARVQVHPIVVMSVLDAYMRRQAGLTRVIGTLLGTRTANLVEVTSCFCVPHQQDAEGTVAFDEEYNKRMLALKKTVSHGEDIVGWFSTTAEGDSDLDFMTAYIHDHYSQTYLGADTIHLVVDTTCAGDKVNIAGYVGSSLALGSDPLAAKFNAIRVNMTASSTEKIACDIMIKSAMLNVAGGEDTLNTSGDVDSLVSNLDNLENSVVRLLEILDTTSDYVQAVLSGKTERNDAIGKEIFKALASVPRMNPEVFGKIFNDRLQDMLMVVYLSNLTRAQLAICDKIAQSDALIGEA